MTMRWLEHGAGRPVVFVHGVPTSPELWRHVMPRLSGVRALVWEMVGYGRSIAEGRGRDLSIAAQSGYLAAWMRHLWLDRPVLVGHDLGGGIAQIAAAREPRACGGLLLTNCVAYDNWPVPSVAALRATAPAARRLPDALLKALLLSFYIRGHEGVGAARAAYRLHAPSYLESGAMAALATQVRALNNRDTLQVADALGRLDLPARLVWGAADGFLPIRWGERLARDLRAPLRRIDGGKHFVPEDRPEVIADKLMALVREAG